MSEFPRLLLVSASAFNNLSGGGITFTNLFRGYPKDRIATVTNDYIPVTKEVCEKYYFLTRREFPWSFPFSAANFFGGQEKIEKTLRGGGGADESSGKNFKTKILRGIQKIAQKIFGNEIPISPILSLELKEWISKFKPQVLYTILGNLHYIRLVRKISDEFNLPIVIHMMDDWPEVSYRKGLLARFQRNSMERELQEIIRSAAACLSICDAMSEAYEKRYGRPFQAFANVLDADEWLKKSRKDWQAGHPFTIVYAGALMPDSQLHSVKDVCDAVAKLHSEGADITFQIYAPWFFANQYRSELERPSCVYISDAPETMDIESLFSRADLLLLPVNFDKATTKYVKYSMPTKIPAYMFSGTPTLAYGPASVASIAYAHDYQWAYCVTARRQEALYDAIHGLSRDEELRKKFGTHAQKIAQEKHDAAKVRPEFHAVIAKAANRKIW